MSQQSAERAAARRLAREILQEAAPDPAGTLSRAVTRLEDVELRQGVIDALCQVQEPARLDQVWETWFETRHPDLEMLLIKIGVPAVYPLPLNIISALKLSEPLGKLFEFPSDEAEIVEPLLQAAADHDPQIANAAKSALSGLENPAAQDELCRWVIEYDHAIARQIALEANFYPRDPHQRALFFLLTEQWTRYESLDFDSSLLSAVYRAGDAELRLKISGFARRSGWSGFVESIASSRSARRLDALQRT